MDLTGKSILITGGTGSFGTAFVRKIINGNYNVKRLVIYSRDELKQYQMSQEFPQSKDGIIRYFIGDVRDEDRLKLALKNIDIVIHAAALKQVPAAEYNPMECIKTNVLGAQNVISAAMACNVKKIVALSTDKAAAPVNLYGATKLCSDKLFVAANNLTGSEETNFSVVRYGNVMGSRGSVIPFFEKQRLKGSLPITDEKMTRFNITLNEGVNMVMHAINNAIGGEIFVPKIPSYNIMDLATAIAPNVPTEIIGLRPGEKIHEEMITVADAPMTVDIGEYYVILPNTYRYDIDQYIEQFGGIKVAENFTYNSGQNVDFLSIDQLRDLITQNLGITV